MQESNILNCRPASFGMAIGRPVIISTCEDIGLVQEGDILVAKETDISYVPAMQKASAIITERGGRFCHAAVWARENQKPVVLQAIDATTILKDKEKITVDADNGTITW